MNEQLSSNVKQEKVVRLPNEASSFSCLLGVGRMATTGTDAGRRQ